MYDDEDEERTEWEKNIDDAMSEHLGKVVPGVPWDEIPPELLKEAEDVARDVVGPDPDADDASGEEE